MANRYPLTINNSSTLVGELPNGDSLNLSGSGIFDGSSLGSSGQVLKSTGSSLQWSRAADVYRTDAQTLLNKTLSSCIFNASLNTLTNVSNASLINSSISINGTNVPLGGSISITDQNDNTIYGVSFQNGPNASSKRFRLTAGGSGSGDQDLFFAQGDNVTITKNNSNDTLTISSALTKLRANTSAYIEGSISLTGSGGTSVSRSGQTFTFFSDAFPVGGIIIWSGSTSNIPTKWSLCDGGTVAGYGAKPDLRNRFVIGSGSSYSVNTTGGSKDASIITHSHTATTGNQSANHTHGGTSDNNNRGHTHSGNTGNNSGNHTHSGNTGNQSANHSHSGNTGNQSRNHNHSGNTGTQNRNHNHSGVTSNQSANHSHGYENTSGGTDHDGDGRGTPLRSNANNSNTGGNNSNHKHNFNTNGPSQNHSHNFNTGGISQNHTHSFNTGNQSANHSHSFNTGNQSANHTHAFTTGGISQNHTHTFNTGNQSSNHTHSLTTSNEGVSGTNKNLPPYYALCYIIKVQ